MPSFATMSTRRLLIFTAALALCIGGFALLFPALLLEGKGVGTLDPAAVAMTRTVGVALLGVAGLNLALSGLPSSGILRRVLLANAAFQLALLPLDPWACATGAFEGLASFLPNSILHVVLATLFLRAWRGTAADPCLGSPRAGVRP